MSRFLPLHDATEIPDVCRNELARLDAEDDLSRWPGHRVVEEEPPVDALVASALVAACNPSTNKP